MRSWARRGTSPCRRRATTVARLPPALSPATAIRVASPPISPVRAASHRTAASASSSPAGDREVADLGHLLAEAAVARRLGEVRGAQLLERHLLARAALVGEQLGQ